jgi:DNA polymerase-3 subunit beta
MSKFIASSSALLKVLTPLVAVISNNPVVPILENFLFSVANGLLTITASDLEVSMVTALPVEVGKAEEFSLAVPARRLLEVLKQLPDQPVTFDLDTQDYRIQLDTANGRFKWPGEKADDYPRVPVVNPATTPALELPSSVLAQAIRKTLFGLSTDELRPAMTGVLVQLEPNQLTFVATDGHRLLRYRRTDLGGGGGRNLIIPRKAWGLVKSNLPTEATLVKVVFGTSNVLFTINGLTIVARLIDERYPDYENVIPVSNPNVLIINRTELLNSVRRCAIMSNRTTHQVRLHLSGSQVVLSAHDLDFDSEGTETLTCQYAGEDMEIGFSAVFLQEVLTNIGGEEVSLALSTPNRAGLLSPTVAEDDEDVLMLVMPTMLNNYV